MIHFPEIDYLTWAKTVPPVDINLARSGIDHCPASLLELGPSDVVVNLPVRWGYRPLLDAIASRYRVGPDQVFTVSGGAGFATWLAAAAALHDAPADAEVIVERPTYEPLLRIPQSLGAALARLDRVFDERWAIDLDRFAPLVTRRTRLAIVSNLHNPSGARIGMNTLREMASLLADVDGILLVDEVYLECTFADRTDSCVHAGGNVLATNSLTKAYGLDGLRAGWILGPSSLVRRAALIHDLLANNGVAPGEQMQLAAFEHLPRLAARARRLLDPNLDRVRAFFGHERRLSAFVPEGGNVVFPRLPESIDGGAFCDRLRERYSTLVVPGRFFDSPRHIRISFGMEPSLLARGLENISRALDEAG